MTTDSELTVGIQRGPSLVWQLASRQMHKNKPTPDRYFGGDEMIDKSLVLIKYRPAPL